MKEKINLTLLRKLIDQLDENLSNAEKLQQDKNYDNNDFVIEMSKGIGMAASITQEATLLITDIQALIRLSQTPQQSKNTVNFLDKLFVEFKNGSGNSGGSSGSSN